MTIDAPITALPAHPSSAARTRAYRERQRQGATLVRLNITLDGARALQHLGWLAPGDAGDPNAIAAAILALGSAALTKGLRASSVDRDETSGIARAGRQT